MKRKDERREKEVGALRQYWSVFKAAEEQSEHKTKRVDDGHENLSI
jgi:hypothetical protein